ncbi:MAG: hypothetical protein ACFB9N_05200 [Geitlerinemataceae cyanobacterium]
MSTSTAFSFKRWLRSLRQIESPLAPIAIAIGFYLAINLCCWVVVRHLMNSLESGSHQLTLGAVDAETGETELDRYIAQFRDQLYPNLREIQAERIKRQYLEVAQRQSFHIQLAEIFYVNYLTGLIFAPFASALAAFCLFSIGRQGWAQTDDLTIDTFKVAFAATVLTSAFMLIFDYENNTARQVELFTEYEKLQSSMQSYLATGRLYVKPNLPLSPLLAPAVAPQPVAPQPPLLDADELPAPGTPEFEEPAAPSADVRPISWIYKPNTFIEYVDNEMARLRSETVLNLDPSGVPSTQDILNQLETFTGSPVVEPANPEAAPTPQ